MKNQITPTPWRVKPYGARFAVYGAVHPVDGGDYAPIATYLEEADAHLMAAAPELLEALRGALEYFEGPPFLALHGDMRAKLTRATIAKAEGK